MPNGEGKSSRFSQTRSLVGYLSDKSDARRRSPQGRWPEIPPSDENTPTVRGLTDRRFQPPGKETLPYEVVESLLRHAGPHGHGDLGFGRSLWGREELWLHAELPAKLLPSGDLQALLPDEVHVSASDCLLQACLQPVCAGHLLPSGLPVCDSGSADSLRSAVCSGLPAGLPAARLCGSGLRSRELRPGLPAGLRSVERPGLLRSGVLPEGSYLLCSEGVLPEGSDVLRSERVLPEGAELRSSGELLHHRLRSQVQQEVLRSRCLRSGSLDLRLADGLPRQGPRQGDRSPRRSV